MCTRFNAIYYNNNINVLFCFGTYGVILSFGKEMTITLLMNLAQYACIS